MDSFTRFAESLFRLNGLMIAAGETITRPIGQSSARWQVLGGLGYGPRTVADIARSIGHARQSVQRVADLLIGEGLVVQRDKPNDRRTVLLELTHEGKAVLGAIYKGQLAWSNRITKGLTDKQLDALAAALGKIGDVIDTDIKQNGPAP
jgi:DNA-binding MarR family transcriptional regulator